MALVAHLAYDMPPFWHPCSFASHLFNAFNSSSDDFNVSHYLLDALQIFEKQFNVRPSSTDELCEKNHSLKLLRDELISFMKLLYQSYYGSLSLLSHETSLINGKLFAQRTLVVFSHPSFAYKGSEKCLHMITSISILLECKGGMIVNDGGSPHNTTKRDMDA